jgi:hypothetical protein
VPLANANSLTVAVETTSDVSGIESTDTAIEGLAAKIEIAKQKMLEASQVDSTKASTMMQLQNNLSTLNGKFDEEYQKLDEERVATQESATTHENLAASIVGAQAAYNILYGALQKSIQFFTSAIDSANNYQRAIAGLNSTSRAMSDNVDLATQAAQKLSSDGLMPVTQSATALRNLLAAGFSLPQAIELMDALKDKLAFNRQGYDNMGDAVVHATKGIELGNTKMLEATGVNEKMNAMLKEAGVSASNLGNLQESAAARQAIVNGVLKNAAGNYGDAAKATDVFGAKQAAAGTAVENLKISLGGIEQLIGGPLIQAFTAFLNGNQKAIIDFGTAAVVATGLGVAIFGVVKAIQAFSLESLIAVATNPLILMLTTLSVLAGVVVYNAVDKLQSKVKEMNNGLGAGADATNNLTDSTNQLTASQQSLADKLQQIDEQLAKNNRDFMESLATAIQSIEDKASSLKEQIDQENTTFANSQAKNLDTFTKTQDSMTDAHQKRVDTIQKQLDQQTALGKWADQTKLADLQQQLSDENDQYNQQLSDQQATYNQSVADAKQAHNEKVTDLQNQLDQENALLKKHAADVAAVQNVTMLDTIDKIKQTHDDQIAALDDQRQKAIQSAQQTVNGINNAYTTGLSSANGGLATIGSTLGNSMGSAFKSALESSLKDTGKSIVNFLGSAVTFIKDGFDPSKSKESLSQIWNDALKNPAFHLAAGGPVMAGQPYLVGDNPDGSINDTTELFVPSQSGTVVPAGQTRSLLGSASGGQGVTIHQTNHIYNQVDMDAANVELGWKLVNA